MSLKSIGDAELWQWGICAGIGAFLLALGGFLFGAHALKWLEEKKQCVDDQMEKCARGHGTRT